MKRLIVGSIASIAALVAVVAWLRARLLIVTVTGPSMRPTYAEGDRLLVRRRQPVRRGDVVVADTAHTLPAAAAVVVTGARPVDGRVVKRVAAVPGDPTPPGVPDTDGRVPVDRYVLLGDNPRASTDSRHYGCIEASAIIGVVTRRLR